MAEKLNPMELLRAAQRHLSEAERILETVEPERGSGVNFLELAKNVRTQRERVVAKHSAIKQARYMQLWEMASGLQVPLPIKFYSNDRSTRGYELRTDGLYRHRPGYDQLRAPHDEMGRFDDWELVCSALAEEIEKFIKDSGQLEEDAVSVRAMDARVLKLVEKLHT